MISRDSAAMRGTKPLLRLQFQCPGEPCPPGELWAPCRALAPACSHGGCSASWAVSLLVNPDWKVFLSLCIMNQNLLRIVVNTVYGEGSQQLWGCQGILECALICWVRGKASRSNHIPVMPGLVVPLVSGWHYNDTRFRNEIADLHEFIVQKKWHNEVMSKLSRRDLWGSPKTGVSSTQCLKGCCADPSLNILRMDLVFQPKVGWQRGLMDTVLKIRTTHFAGFKWMKINSPTTPLKYKYNFLPVGFCYFQFRCVIYLSPVPRDRDCFTLFPFQVCIQWQSWSQWLTWLSHLVLSCFYLFSSWGQISFLWDRWLLVAGGGALQWVKRQDLAKGHWGFQSGSYHAMTLMSDGCS